jgi:CRP/FNR family transcriptional regulator
MINHLQKLGETYATRDFPAGSIILYQGEVPRSACVLLEGTVKVYSISSQGDNQIVTFHVAGEFFPSSWIFGKAPSTMFYYEAVSDCKVALCSRKELIDFMLGSNERMHAMLDYFTTNYSAFLIRVHALEQSKARDKLVNTLYYLCHRYVKAVDPDSHVTIPLELTHQDLAGLVGLTRETTAIEMNKLKNEKIIEYNQQCYTVNVSKLLDLMGEDSFRNIAIAD